MWLAKWFGRRAKDDQVDDDEPARFPTVHAAHPGPTVQKAPLAKSTANNQPAKGFDPYNSGAFEQRNAWSRVGRR